MQDKINQSKKKDNQHLNDYYNQFNKSQIEINDQLLNDNFNSKIQLNEDSLIIDYGGGSGQHAQYFFKKLNLKNDVLCMDPSSDMVHLASKKNGVKSMVFDPLLISIDNNDVPQLYKKVDLIFLSGCIHFVGPQEKKRYLICLEVSQSQKVQLLQEQDQTILNIILFRIQCLLNLLDNILLQKFMIIFCKNVILKEVSNYIKHL